MALRAKKPEAIKKRLKLFMYGPAGVGKTTAAIQMARPYIIDSERGVEHAKYVKLINESGGAVLQTNDANDVLAEVKALLTEKHDFRTLVIDPITPIYNDLLEKSEKKVGSDFGRHYGEANKVMKRLMNLITALDMNVVMTAHAKKEYGDNLKVLGQTFDGWKSLDYLFDLVLELSREKGRKNAKRYATVVKTRLDEFPDQDVFEWTYDEVRNRYGGELLEREAKVVEMATPDQVRQLKELLDIVKLPEGTTEKWLAKAGVEAYDDMPADAISKCIDYVRGRMPSTVAAA
jgi:DNA polymerase III delta prime subunit